MWVRQSPQGRFEREDWTNGGRSHSEQETSEFGFCLIPEKGQGEVWSSTFSEG